MSKYTGEKLEFVFKELENKKDMTIVDACKKMCLKFDMEYCENVRKGVSALIHKSNLEPEISDLFKEAQSKKLDKKKGTFIITYAQNDTPVHKKFFENILALKEDVNAGLHVIAGRYKNPTSIYTTREEAGEWWVKEVRPYLDANRHNLHKYLHVLADVKITPTASNPLGGFNSITGLESCIIGHPRQHLKSLPVLSGYPNKLLLSTGACTVSNYTDSGAGKKGDFHHMLGFIIVEIDGDSFHVRQVNADEDGNFYDLFKRVKDGKVTNNKEGCSAAILGDIHISQVDKQAEEAAFKLLDILKPKYTIIHDIFNGESISHHTSRYPFQLMELEETGRGNVEWELEQMYEWVKKRLKYNLVIPAANHNDWMDQWLSNNDWRKERNKKAYLKYAFIASEKLAPKGMIAYLLDKMFGKKITTLDYDGSFRYLDWELGLHGDKGSNGSRGGVNQFKNLNTKSVTGHSHTPSRNDGHLCVGTLTLMKMGYNKGLSTWMQSNVLIYPDGKAQHVHFVNGKYYR